MSDDAPEPADVEHIATNKHGPGPKCYHLYPERCPSLAQSTSRPVHAGEIGSRSLTLCGQCEAIREGYDGRGGGDYDWSAYNALANADAEEVFADDD